jgi:hypothetical protein
VATWLAPEGLEKSKLADILSDRQCPFYEHRIAA